MPNQNETTQEHPFDAPNHFGEDGGWIAVRGDISRHEAYGRIKEYDCSSSIVPGDWELRDLQPGEIHQCHCYLAPELDAWGDAVWTLWDSSEPYSEPHIRVVSMWAARTE
jgi:hypothetical protein